VLFLRQGKAATQCWPGGRQSPTVGLQATQRFGTRTHDYSTGGPSTSASKRLKHTVTAGTRLLSSALTVTPALGCTARVPHEDAVALPARLGCCGAALIACMGEEQAQPTLRAGRSKQPAAHICAGVC